MRTDRDGLAGDVAHYFSEFFNANFKGNEIKGMTSNEVIACVNAIVRPLCHNFICNYDVPND